MNTSIGTQIPKTTGRGAENGASSNQKTGEFHKMDALKMRQEFGGKSLEEVLNSVADPNYEKAQRRVKGVGNAELGKDAFFKLMLTQLKQQDPTNPLKSHEMAAQLAQFSSVEQLTNMNQSLEKMSQKEGQKGKFDVLSLIGKKVSGDSSQIDRMKGDKDHSIEFHLPQRAEKVQVTIKDEKGMTIKTYDLKNLKQGRNQLVWNGLHSDGREARVGEYSAHISAETRGHRLQPSTQFSGAVDGVQFTAKGPVLMVGGKTLKLRDVKRIEEMLSMKGTGAIKSLRPDKKVSKGAHFKAPLLNNLDMVKMDKEFLEKTKKAPLEKSTH